MNESNYSEDTLQHRLRQSENGLNRATLDSLASAREEAMQAKKGLLSNFSGVFSAGLVTAALVAFAFLPLGNQVSTTSDTDVIVEDNALKLLMEDPEFFLWLSNSYSSVTQ